MNHHLVISWLGALAQAAVFVVLAWPLVAGARRLSAARLSTLCRMIMAGTVALALAAFVFSTWRATNEGGAAPTTAGRNTNRLPSASTEAAAALWLENGDSRVSESSPSAAKGASSGNVLAFIPRWTLDPAWRRVLWWMWLAGAGVAALPWLRGRRARTALWRQSRAAVDDDPLAVAVRASAGFPACRIRVHEGTIAPCVWGVWRPVLMLPAAARSWPVERLRLVLAHEGAHLRRRDPWWRCLTGVFLALLWFHPLAWSLARRARQADERAADDAVLAQEGDAPGYAETLLECARLFAVPAPLSRAAFLMAGPGVFPARVRAVLDPRRDRRTAGVGTWASGLLLVLAIAGLAAVSAPRLAAAETADLVEKVEETAAEGAAETEAAADEAEEKPAVSPPWTPIEIEGRKYLRASEVRAFYKFSSAAANEAGELVFQSPKLAMRWKTSPSELHINGVKLRTRHPLRIHEGEWMISGDDLSKLLDPVLRPREIKNAGTLKTIILDPGHGGMDSGATGGGGSEAAFSLDLARRLRPLLEQSGFTVRLTREEDRFVSLDDRAAVAEGVTEGAVISLHFNSSRLASDRGVQTGFPAAGIGQDKHLSAAVALATAVQARCLHQLKTPDAGVMALDLGLMRRITYLPVIFINAGNLSFDEEAAAIVTEAYRERLAAAIASGVATYRHATADRPPR